MSDGVKILIAVVWAGVLLSMFFAAVVFCLEWWHQFAIGGPALETRWWQPVAYVGKFTFFILVIGYLSGVLFGWW